MKKQSNSMKRATRFYASLVWLYPRKHRRAFGAQMRQTFKDQYRGVSEQEGKVRLAFWLAVISDEVKSIAKERATALQARRILPILMLLIVIGLAAVAIFPIIPVLAILVIAPLLAMLVKAGGRGRMIAAMMVVALGALGIFGIQGAVRGATTNTWCTTAHAPSSQPPATLATAADYFVQGDYDYDRGDCTQAIADYSQAITLDPAYAEAYNNRAYTYMAQQEYARALPDLDQAIQLRPDYVHALMNRGDIYNYYYNIDRARAIRDYDRIIALGPDAMRQTSVCGHRFLAVHNGWNLGTILHIPGNVRDCSSA